MAKKEKPNGCEPSEETQKELLEAKEFIRSGIEKVINEGADRLEKALVAGEARDCCGGNADLQPPGVKLTIKLVTSHHIVDALGRAAESLRDQEIEYMIGIFRKQDLELADGAAKQPGKGKGK